MALTCDLFKPNIRTLLVWETFTPIMFSTPVNFVFELGARARRTDGQTDEQNYNAACLENVWRDGVLYCRWLSHSVFQSLVAALVLTKLDFRNATLAGIPSFRLDRLQAVMNAAARLVFQSNRYSHITPLL